MGQEISLKAMALALAGDAGRLQWKIEGFKKVTFPKQYPRQECSSPASSAVVAFCAAQMRKYSLGKPKEYFASGAVFYFKSQNVSLRRFNGPGYQYFGTCRLTSPIQDRQRSLLDISPAWNQHGRLLSVSAADP